MVILSRLKNINGVTCYMNSILNILFQTKKFISLILNKNYNINNNNINNNNIILINELSDLFKIFYDNKNCVVNPLKFVRCIHLTNPKWNIMEQQDSHEFLIMILNEFIKNTQQNNIKYINLNINNEIPSLDNIIIYNKYKKCQKNEYSELIDIFTGYNKIIKKCWYCKITTINIEKYLTLLLNITNNSTNLQNSIINYCKDEEIKYKCKFCGYNKHNIRTEFYKLPNILIINFKNFDNLGNKINNNIIYDELLTLHINNKIIKYDLYAINVHLGNSLNFGHYISIIKNYKDNKWYLHNDEDIIEQSEFKKFQPYILFYKLLS